MTYTLSAGLAVLAALALDLIGLRTALVRRQAFWTAYAIVFVFQLVVNGVLTGVPIVRYDRHRILGARLAYAPVEDLAFGFAMVLVTLTVWVALNRRAARRTARPVGPATPPRRRAPRRRRAVFGSPRPGE